MALVNVASKLPMAVIITSNPPAEGQDPLYSYEIAGERDPSAVGGWGITYNVEDVAYNDWTAKHTDQASHLKLVTQADIDEMADTIDEYGYELGLDEGTSTVLGAGAAMGTIKAKSGKGKSDDHQKHDFTPGGKIEP